MRVDPPNFPTLPKAVRPTEETNEDTLVLKFGVAIMHPSLSE